MPRLRKVFDIVGIEWTGSQHIGIDDARNTAKLAHKWKDEIKITHSFGICGRIKGGDSFRFIYSDCLQPNLMFRMKNGTGSRN